MAQLSRLAVRLECHPDWHLVGSDGAATVPAAVRGPTVETVPPNLPAVPTPGAPPHLIRVLIDALRGKDHDLDYARMPLGRAVLLLAVPMALEMVMESVFAVADIWFVGQLGDAAVATVGLTESMLTIVYALAIGLAMGVTALVARRVGANDRPGAARAAAQGIRVAWIAGIALGIPCAVFAGDLLALMGAEPAVVAVGSSYAAFVLGSQVIVVLLFVHNAVFRGAGDAARAMQALWLANAVNLVLDPCLIFGLGPFPELGLTGAAIATCIGRGVGVLFQVRLLFGGRTRIALDRGTQPWSWPEIREVLAVSAGGVAQFLIATASWLALMRITAAFGTVAVAGYTIAVRVVMFTLLPAWGISNAAATLVGQSLGAEDPPRAMRSIWFTGAVNMAFLTIVMVACLVFGPTMIGLFRDDADVVRTGAAALRIMTYGYLAYAWGMVLIQALNGAGDTMTPTWINLGCFWALEIPLAWWLAERTSLGVDGVFWSVAISESTLAAVTFLVLRTRPWTRG